MAESLSVMERALLAGYTPRSVLTEQKWLTDVAELLDSHRRQPPIYVGDRSVIRATTGFRMHRGPMAAMDRRPLPSADEVVSSARLVLVLAGLVDHTNVGAAFRSAAALGVDAILVTADCADPLYRRSVRVSMGAVFAVPWTVSDDWPAALSSFRTVALTPAADAIPVNVIGADPRPTAIVVGTEGPGLSGSDQDRAEIRARIPMSAEVDSLNVAAAVAVAVYALAGTEFVDRRSQRIST